MALIVPKFGILEYKIAQAPFHRLFRVKESYHHVEWMLWILLYVNMSKKYTETFTVDAMHLCAGDLNSLCDRWLGSPPHDDKSNVSSCMCHWFGGRTFQKSHFTIQNFCCIGLCSCHQGVFSCSCLWRTSERKAKWKNTFERNCIDPNWLLGLPLTCRLESSSQSMVQPRINRNSSIAPFLPQ